MFSPPQAPPPTKIRFCLHCHCLLHVKVTLITIHKSQCNTVLLLATAVVRVRGSGLLYAKVHYYFYYTGTSLMASHFIEYRNNL